MAQGKTRIASGQERAYPSGQRLAEKEQEELERRWQDTMHEMFQILKHVPDIRVTRCQDLPPEFGVDQRKWLIASLVKSLLEGESRPELKRTVVRRMADRFGQYLLWNRLSSTPALHEFWALFPWWVSHLPLAGMDKLRDIGLAYVLNGLVIPVQTVWRELLSAQAVLVGHCVCRSSGIAADLPAKEPFENLLDETGSALIMDRISSCYVQLKESGHLAETDPFFLGILEELEGLKKRQPARYRLERLLRSTYPNWEFLPVDQKYTTDWIRSMHQNRKARQLHKRLAMELATALYFSHGIIFTTMRLFDTPYTICSCPSPERGGGCVLTNWYYYGQSNASLLPNEEYPGRNLDERGFVLPCSQFQVRGRRECLGCGCLHDAAEPRRLEVFLAEADQLIAEVEYGKKSRRRSTLSAPRA